MDRIVEYRQIIQRFLTKYTFKLPRFQRVSITVLADETEESINLARMSEIAMAKDWDRPEEDEAWSHLADLPSAHS